MGSVYRLTKLAHGRHRWIPLEGAQGLVVGPQPGDAFVQLRRGLERPGPGHVGIVLRVSEDGREYTTVEGNSGDRVRLGRRALEADSILGVISPLPLRMESFELGLIGGEDVSGLGTR